jgi:hypothetical protein
LIPIRLCKPSFKCPRGIFSGEAVIEVLGRARQCGCGVVVVHDLEVWLRVVWSFGKWTFVIRWKTPIILKEVTQ